MPLCHGETWCAQQAATAKPPHETAVPTTAGSAVHSLCTVALAHMYTDLTRQTRLWQVIIAMIGQKFSRMIRVSQCTAT